MHVRKDFCSLTASCSFTGTRNLVPTRGGSKQSTYILIGWPENTTQSLS
jgi:hypothetical protein